MILPGDCIEAMRGMDEASVDAVVCDPPYGLEFMGKEWDRLDSWRDGGGFSKPGIGDRATPWASYGGETANPSCRVCGGRARGAKKCGCDEPAWHVRGEDYRPGEADRARARRMQEWHEAWATEALRVLKPGGHLLAFGGTRTYHRLACAIEDAGFEIRDCLAWMYGSGFPKSLDVSKAIDKAAGVEREVVGTGNTPALKPGPSTFVGQFLDRPDEGVPITAPATPEAAQWQGWGTALKPAHEPIVLARKPLTGTVAANVLEHGTGALNIDGCRVEGPKGDGNWKGKTDRKRGEDFAGFEGGWSDDEPGEQNAGGRWPANVILDPEAAALLDEQSGERRSAGEYVKGSGEQGDKAGAASIPIDGLTSATYGDTGGASRFFYTAKASRAERNAGLEGFEERESREWRTGNAPPNVEHRVPDKRAQNVHPTVKPIALMRWLCRLVTPPGGTILDPFTGSGTTGCAAVLEGFDFVGCEREDEYVRIAEARIAYWARYPGAEVETILASDVDEQRSRGQLDLLGGAA